MKQLKALKTSNKLFSKTINLFTKRKQAVNNENSNTLTMENQEQKPASAVLVICGKNNEDNLSVAEVLMRGNGVSDYQVHETQLTETELPNNIINTCNDLKRVIEEIEKHKNTQNAELTIICTCHNKLTVESHILIHKYKVPEIGFMEIYTIKEVV